LAQVQSSAKLVQRKVLFEPCYPSSTMASASTSTQMTAAGRKQNSQQAAAVSSKPLFVQVKDRATLPEQAAAVLEQSTLPQVAAVPEQKAERSLETHAPSAEKQQMSDMAAKEVTFIEGQFGRVPFVGQYVGPLLSNRYIHPIIQKVDPFVDAGAQKVAPYVEGVMVRVEKVQKGIETSRNQLHQTVKEAPNRVMESVRAAPGRVYQTTTHTLSTTTQKVRAFPAQAFGSAKATASSMAARAKEVPAEISENASALSGTISETIQKTFEKVKVAPTAVFQWSKSSAGRVLDKMRFARSQVNKRAKNTVAYSVESMKAVQNKVISASLSRAEALDSAVQPYVHRLVKAVAPSAESIANNERVQSIYQHRFVQRGIEKAMPYASKVANQPTISDFTKTLMAWAIPSM